jgi:hypothetical protein
MTDKLVGYSLFKESKGDYLARMVEPEDGLVLCGFGTIEQALIYSTLKKCQKALSECSSGVRVVKIFKNSGGLFHKNVA